MRRPANIATRLLLLALAAWPILRWSAFARHFSSYLTGDVLPNLIRGNWMIVILNIIAFLAFLIPLTFRRKARWGEYGIVAAFFVSLFIEMYGIPFTLLFVSRFIGGHMAPADLPPNVVSFSLFGQGFGMDEAMLYGAILMLIGTATIIAGWMTLYRASRDGRLVTTGIYSVSRHPQYLGFILVILGWLVGWTSPLVVIFAPILIGMYLRVCVIEEREMAGIGDYAEYRRQAPFMV